MLPPGKRLLPLFETLELEKAKALESPVKRSWSLMNRSVAFCTDCTPNR